MNKLKGKIVKILSNDYTVLVNNNYYVCKARGKFRKDNITPLVGDNVIFDLEDRYILELDKRKNELIRPYVANIDKAIIVVSVKNPDLDLYLLDKLLCQVEYNNITPIICFTKLDLLDNLEDIDKLRSYYESIGYKVFYNTEIEEIKKCFSNSISVFTGQSGAGKSTLLNKLDIDLDLETNDISYALGRGKHTTRHTELISMFNGLVADTPGFSSLDLSSMRKSDIRDNFIEFNKYRYDCKYSDCMHDKDDDCMIKKLVGNKILESRYLNYIKLIKE